MYANGHTTRNTAQWQWKVGNLGILKGVIRMQVRFKAKMMIDNSSINISLSLTVLKNELYESHDLLMIMLILLKQ